MSGVQDWMKSVAAGRRPAGSIFIPMLEKLAPRVAGISYQQMSSNATAWANAIPQAARLVGTTALALGWDETLLAEACGVPLHWAEDRPQLAERAASFNPQVMSAGRLPAYLEAARRMCISSKPEGACVLAISGVATLARQVFASQPTKDAIEQLKPLLVEVVEALCQGRPEFMVFMEGGPALAGEMTPELRRVYQTLRNIAVYYGVMPVLHLEAYAEWQPAVERWAALKFDHLLLGANAAGQLPVPGAGAEWLSLGLPLDASDLEASRERIALLEGQQGDRGAALFFTTPLHQTVDIEVLRGIGALLGNRS